MSLRCKSARSQPSYRAAIVACCDADKTEGGQDCRTWLGNFCHPEPDIAELHARRKAFVPESGLQVGKICFPRTAAQAPIWDREDRFIPLPHIARHVERAVVVRRVRIR